MRSRGVQGWAAERVVLAEIKGLWEEDRKLQAMAPSLTELGNPSYGRVSRGDNSEPSHNNS